MMHGAHFPIVEGRNLLGGPRVLPRDLAGKLNLLFIAHYVWQQRAVDIWAPLAQQLEARVPGLIGVILRSPLHPLLSREVMLISFTGRKSGRRYTTPVSSIQAGAQFRIFTRTRWWKNVRDGVPVTLVVEGRTVAGVAYADDTSHVVVAAAQAVLAAQGIGAARRLGLSLPADTMPGEEELCAALHSYALITVQVAM